MANLTVYSSFQDFEDFLDAGILEIGPAGEETVRALLTNGVVIDMSGFFVAADIFQISSVDYTAPDGFRFAEIRNVNLLTIPDGSPVFVFGGVSLFLSDASDIVAFPSRSQIDALLFRFSGGAEIDFAGGFDTLSFELERQEAVVDLDDSGTVFFQGPGAPLESYVALERLAFEDGALLFDLAGEDLGYVYRLYDAAFARTPDEAGLRFWAGLVESGEFPREGLAPEFVNSDEFALLFGENPTDEEFVNALYGNVLRREPDAEGLAFWIGVFATGEQTRADMLEFFAESPENVERNVENLDDGVWVI